MSPGASRALDDGAKYGSTSADDDEPALNLEDERLFDNARALEFGDWNYPVITAHTATREHRLYGTPGIITASTNRNLLQPTRENRKRRKSKIQEIQHSVAKGKHRSSTASEEPSSSKSRKPLLGNLTQHESSSSSNSAKSDRSQLVDLVVEDHEAEEVERVRARKEGGPGWNEVASKHFVHAYPEEGQAEEVREGFDPDHPQPHNPEEAHNLDSPFAVGDGDEDADSSKDKAPLVSDEAEQWEHRDYGEEGGEEGQKDHSPQYGSFHEERNAWGSDR